MKNTYTSKNQFANMLEKRAIELDDIRDRLIEAKYSAAMTCIITDEIFHAIRALKRATKALRDAV